MVCPRASNQGATWPRLARQVVRRGPGTLQAPGRAAAPAARVVHASELHMARASDQKYLSPNPGYRKGDRHSGGGAGASAGGKRRRPQDGWEKGDAVREVDRHGGEPIPTKPGGRKKATGRAGP